MEGNDSIHIKITAKFRTFHFLPLMVAGIDSKCTLEIENTGETKLAKKNFRWKIASETIDIGGREKSTGAFYNIYGIELEPGEKKKESFVFRPFIPGHHKLTVGIPDSVKGGDAIVGESAGKEVAGEPVQELIRFHTDPEMNFAGPWYTYFEVYSWYLLAIGIGTFSAFGLFILESAKVLWELLAPGFKFFISELFRSLIVVI